MIPVTLLITASLHPGTLVVITGNPKDAASIKTLGNPSLHEGRQTISMSSYNLFKLCP